MLACLVAASLIAPAAMAADKGLKGSPVAIIFALILAACVILTATMSSRRGHRD